MVDWDQIMSKYRTRDLGVSRDEREKEMALQAVRLRA
jgi:uncharacterized protein YjiS (DUF1127 family)